MHRPALTRLMIILAIVLSSSTGTAWAAGKAHGHDALKLDVVIEGNKLTMRY